MAPLPTNNHKTESLWNSEALNAAWESVDRQVSQECALESELLGSIFAMSVDREERANTSDADYANESNEELLELLTNRRLGRYELRGFIGRGGFGIVLKAHDAELARDVALKIPRPEFLCHPEISSRFLHEARAAASLRHPGIVPVYDVGSFGSVPYIATDLCHGTSLARWLDNRNQTVPPQTAATLLHDIADAVGFAHVRGVIHQDLKPANILLEPSAEASVDKTEWIPQVTDFGLACHIRDGKGINAVQMGGTWQYMAPEQIRGDTAIVGTHSDVYALGLVLCDVMTFRSTGAEAMNETRSIGSTPTDAPEIERRGSIARPRSVPEDLWAIYQRCIEYDPDRRYRDGWELRDDLARFLEGRAVKARPASVTRHLALVAKRHPGTAVLLALLLLGVITALPTFAYLYFRERDARFKAKTTKAAAREFVDSSYVDLVGNKTFDVPGMEEPRRVQMGRVLKFYEALAREEPRDEQGLYDLQVAHHRAADLALHLGQMEKARDHRRQCLAIIDQLLVLDPKNKDYRFAKFHNVLLSATEVVSETANWETKDRAYELILELERDYPDNVEIEEAAITACSQTAGDYHFDRSHWDERMRETMRRLKRFEARHGITEATRQKYASLVRMHATVLAEDGNHSQAAELYREVVHTSEELAAARPESRSLAAEVIAHTLAYAQFLGQCERHDEAKAHIASVIGRTQRLVEDFPNYPAGHSQLIRAHLELGIIESRMSSHVDASLQFRKALELLKAYLRRFPTDDVGRRGFEGVWCHCPDSSMREEAMHLLRSEKQ